MLDPSPSAAWRCNSAQERDLVQKKSGVIQSKNLGDKSKHGSEISGISIQRLHEKVLMLEKSIVGNSVNISDGTEQSVQRSDEKFNVSGFEGKNSAQMMKVPAMHRKEGSSGRPKGTMLEKAIRDLEKIVAESRPPNMEVQDADNSSQAIKRRLPPEIKQRLAKVARLARNLKIMVSMRLSAKQEKDNRVQHIKREVAEMIKLRIPLMKSKLLEQQAGASDDFQEASAEEKEAFKRKYSMDFAIEDKMCDLYDHFIEGLDEDAGPQIRKLYAEVRGHKNFAISWRYWPNRFMDNNGIERAICRAKDRRRAVHAQRKDGEKIRRNKLVATKLEDTSRADAGPIAQSVHRQEKIVVDHSSTSTNKAVSSTASVNVSARNPVSLANGSDVDRLKMEKLKAVSGSSVDP
ncbi:putative pentatricopeptide repeat-containing protein, mitochondrial-like [Capsicum annuum]|nr:putative pentatricopeptide repeat-containing protein, mitochondrial-like [Capsicum annuum]